MIADQEHNPRWGAPDLERFYCVLERQQILLLALSGRSGLTPSMSAADPNADIVMAPPSTSDVEVGSRLARRNLCGNGAFKVSKWH